MTSEIVQQEKFWDSRFEDFDAIYTQRKSRMGRTLDRIFRKDMYERFRFTIEHCEPIRGRCFLDVGCGSGRYSTELARRGAKLVTGLDISQKMLMLARRISAEAGVGGVCRFVKSDLLNFSDDTKYDVAILIGLLDYIRDPSPVLKKARQMSSEKVIISLPRMWTWRAPVRKLRLRLKGSCVYFYSRRRISNLLVGSGFSRWEVTKVGTLNCVVALTSNLSPAQE